MYSSSISFLSFDSSYKKILFYLHFLNYNSLRAIMDIFNVKNIVQTGILHSISHLLQLGIVLSDTLWTRQDLLSRKRKNQNREKHTHWKSFSWIQTSVINENIFENYIEKTERFSYISVKILKLTDACTRENNKIRLSSVKENVLHCDVYQWLVTGFRRKSVSFI